MKKILITIGIVICLICGGFFVYTSDYYHASEEAMEVINHVGDIKIEETDDYIAFIPKQVDNGLIFYPGGLVETESYAPLMKECANKGMLCVLVKMPFHLAVFNIRGANGIQEKYNIDNWYIGGHSLGGSMAASYVNDHIEEYKGLILLASYSTEDLSKSNINVISIYGSEDKVLSLDKYAENKVNLPVDYKEYIIQGGNHAYFGSYGEQDGDGKATITHQQQVQQTVKYIVNSVEIQ